MAPMSESSCIPFTPLDEYGLTAKRILEHPEDSLGQFVSCAPFLTTYPELVEAFTNVTGKEAVFHELTQNQWFQVMSAYVDPEAKLPRGVDEKDPTAFTFRKTFGAWWNLWHDNIETWTRRGRGEYQLRMLEGLRISSSDEEGWVYGRV